MLAGQEPASQRIVSDHANALFRTQGQEFIFPFAEQEVVARLDAVVAADSVFIAHPQRLCKLVGTVVTASDIAYFARAHQIVQGTEGFVKWRLGAIEMDLVEIDEISLQTAQ